MDQDSQWALEDQALREKVASTMLRLDEEVRGHTKRAHALRLLYKQAEMGVADLPETYAALEAKLASMVREDLLVLEKALELTGGNVKIGTLADTLEPADFNASEQFQAAILGN